MRACFAALLALLLLAESSRGEEPLRVNLVGDLRPLSIPGADSFEQRLVEAWAGQLGRTVTLVEEHTQAELWLGPLPEGVAFYQSEPAVLVRREDRLSDLRALQGKVFCLVEGSPHGALFAQRFNATARTVATSAHALAGLRQGRCQAVVEDRFLLERVSMLPGWRAEMEVLGSLPEHAITFRVLAKDVALQSALQPLVDKDRLALTHSRPRLEEVAAKARQLSDGE